VASKRPRRSDFVITGGRGTPTVTDRGEPHPTLIRTPAAQPRKVERLCQGTCPGRSRYAFVPSTVAIQKATGSLSKESVPIGTAGGWGDRPGEDSFGLQVAVWRGSGGFGMATSQSAVILGQRYAEPVGRPTIGPDLFATASTLPSLPRRISTGSDDRLSLTASLHTATNRGIGGGKCRAPINPFVVEFCEETLSTIRLTSRASARVR
jgi:hypothetical protein